MTGDPIYDWVAAQTDAFWSASVWIGAAAFVAVYLIFRWRCNRKALV